MENADNRKVLPSAQDYINGNQFQRNDNQEILEEFRYKMKWRETETVLDIGCGPGDVTNDLLSPVIKVY
jgi:juvenile hormone acid methyltransferase